MYQEVSWWGQVICCLPVYAFMIYAYECNSTVAPHICTVPQSISPFSMLESSTLIAQYLVALKHSYTVSVDVPTLLYVRFISASDKAGGGVVRIHCKVCAVQISNNWDPELGWVLNFSQNNNYSRNQNNLWINQIKISQKILPDRW